MTGDRTQVLDHGYVQLLDSMGGDIDIVQGARTSFDTESELHFAYCPDASGDETERWASCLCPDLIREDRSVLSKRDAGLINFLMRSKHTSPFEQVQIKFAVKAPIFVFREWMRHRTQSFSEMSGRYVELQREFYVPARDDIREQKGKPGAYYYERMEDDDAAEQARAIIDLACSSSFTDYENLLSKRVAKEVARLVLPVNTFSKMVVSANLLNWMRFLSLRNHEHAQLEIRRFAEVIEKMLGSVAPVAMAAFVEHGRLR